MYTKDEGIRYGRDNYEELKCKTNVEYWKFMTDGCTTNDVCYNS